MAQDPKPRVDLEQHEADLFGDSGEPAAGNPAADGAKSSGTGTTGQDAGKKPALDSRAAILQEAGITPYALADDETKEIIDHIISTIDVTKYSTIANLGADAEKKIEQVSRDLLAIGNKAGSGFFAKRVEAVRETVNKVRESGDGLVGIMGEMLKLGAQGAFDVGKAATSKGFSGLKSVTSKAVTIFVGDKKKRKVEELDGEVGKLIEGIPALVDEVDTLSKQLDADRKILEQLIVEIEHLQDLNLDAMNERHLYLAAAAEKLRRMEEEEIPELRKQWRATKTFGDEQKLKAIESGFKKLDTHFNSLLINETVGKMNMVSIDEVKNYSIESQLQEIMKARSHTIPQIIQQLGHMNVKAKDLLAKRTTATLRQLAEEVLDSNMTLQETATQMSIQAEKQATFAVEKIAKTAERLSAVLDNVAEASRQQLADNAAARKQLLASVNRLAIAQGNLENSRFLLGDGSEKDKGGDGKAPANDDRKGDTAKAFDGASTRRPSAANDKGSETDPALKDAIGQHLKKKGGGAPGGPA